MKKHNSQTFPVPKTELEFYKLEESDKKHKEAKSKIAAGVGLATIGAAAVTGLALNELPKPVEYIGAGFAGSTIGIGIGNVIQGERARRKSISEANQIINSVSPSSLTNPDFLVPKDMIPKKPEE